MISRRSWDSPSGLLILLLLFLAGSAESRSVLRPELVGNEEKPHEFALDLNSTNLDDAFKETLVPHAILEFFAHWCPACRNYKPHYERVAKLFNGPNAAHPGFVLMARVDCALKINSKLCEAFSISHYPTLFWGPPEKFIGASWKPDEKSELSEIKEWMTADLLLKWIGKQLNRSFSLEDNNVNGEESPKSFLSKNLNIQAANARSDIEEATRTAFDIILQDKMVQQSTRSSLVNFLQLLVAHHPSKECRKGTANLLVNFDEIFPSEPQEASTILSNFNVCGADAPRDSWTFCRGSTKDTRGYSCGLWVLLHSISVRTNDAESPFAFKSVCEFIHNFFRCEECRKHFYTMCSSTNTTINTSRDLALWLWGAHNKVNQRLMKVEESLKTGDPQFPKVLWPPSSLCPLCHVSETGAEFDEKDWNLDNVYRFLTRYYSISVVLKDREVMEVETASSVTLGAVLTIALLCCCFGGFACYWRTLQKNRKPKKKVIDGR